MRDPERIDPLLQKLGHLWKKYPDLRLCQLISILAWHVGAKGDIFYTEDESIEQAIDELEKEDPQP